MGGMLMGGRIWTELLKCVGRPPRGPSAGRRTLGCPSGPHFFNQASPSPHGENRGTALAPQLARGRPEDDRVPEIERRGHPCEGGEGFPGHRRDPVLWGPAHLPRDRRRREPVRRRPAEDRSEAG